MATGNGGLHFEPTMDVNGIRKSAQEVKREITDTTTTKSNTSRGWRLNIPNLKSG